MSTLEKRIQRAFGCNENFKPVEQNEAEDWNHRINRLAPDRAKDLLPFLLISEMHTTHQYPFQGTGDHLIYYLDGYLLADTERSERAEHHDGLRTQEALIRKRFAGYSRDQASVIVQWLREIAKPKYGRLCGSDIDSAICFWESKACE